MAGKRSGQQKRAKKAEIATTDAVEVLPAAVAESVIDEVYTEIRELVRDTGLDLSIRMGKLIVARFFGDDLDAWRLRGAKDASFRKLAERFDKDQNAPEGTSTSALYRAVAIFEIDERIGVSARKQLTASHIRAVIGLPEDKQEKLLDLAEEKKWATRKLEEEAAKIRKKEGDGRGRPALPMYVKTIHKLEKFVDDGDAAFEGIDDLDALDNEEATRLYQAVTGMKLKCEELQKKLGAKVKGH